VHLGRISRKALTVLSAIVLATAVLTFLARSVSLTDLGHYQFAKKATGWGFGIQKMNLPSSQDSYIESIYFAETWEEALRTVSKELREDGWQTIEYYGKGGLAMFKKKEITIRVFRMPERGRNKNLKPFDRTAVELVREATVLDRIKVWTRFSRIGKWFPKS